MGAKAIYAAIALVRTGLVKPIRLVSAAVANCSNYFAYEMV